MNRFKKLCLLFIILLILIFVIYNILDVNELKYKINKNDKVFNIEEKKNKNNFYVEIIKDKTKFLFNIFNIESKNKIVTDIYYYKDKTHECLLPIINDEVKIDMLCYFKDTLYDYTYIKGNNKKLDDYVSKIKEYDNKRFIDDLSKIKTINGIDYYTNNKIDNLVFITTYKGISSIENEISLFENDLYNNKLSIFVDKYYLSADYDLQYEFKNFIVVDLETKKKFNIKSKYEISFDSYIQGEVDGKIYLYDKDNEIQYSIDINNKKINIESTKNKIKYYENNKWTTKTKTSTELYFNYNSIERDFSDYYEVIKTPNYYYLFEKLDDYYKLYQVNINELNIKKYIRNIKTTDIKYKENYIYYVSEDKLCYYSDTTGLKTLLKNSELLFNDTIKYYVY